LCRATALLPILTFKLTTDEFDIADHPLHSRCFENSGKIRFKAFEKKEREKYFGLIREKTRKSLYRIQVRARMRIVSPENNVRANPFYTTLLVGDKKNCHAVHDSSWQISSLIN
jgi:hypothetical protein